MEQFPLVSIAMCTYNGARFLPPQLDTILNQTYKNIEIIVVDDCSTDETISILARYAEKYPQFKIHQNEHNLGFTANFEKAVMLCTADLIAFCDQDDLWHPQKIELQVKGIKENVLIYHDSEFIHEDGSSMNKKMSDLMNLYRGDHPEAFLFFNCISGHEVMMKRELIAHAFPLPKDFFYDWWLAYVATNIGSIDFIPQCLVQYRQHDQSDTNILRLQRKKDVYKFSSVQKITRVYDWLGYCAAFKNNRNQPLIDEIYNAFSLRMKSFISFKLSAILYRHREIIFTIRKKSKLSKLNYIYSQIWGVKAKKVLN